MKQITAIFICSALLLTLTACQPNPDKPFVQSKNIDRLIEKAGDNDEQSSIRDEPIEADLAKRLGVPEKYVTNREYLDGKLTLNADSPIVVPDYAMPLARMEPQEFSQEFADKMYEILIGDTPMYQIPQGIVSKEDIEWYILHFKERISTMEAERENWGNVEDAIAHYKEMIEFYEKRLPNAPDSVYTDEYLSRPGIKTIQQHGEEGYREGELISEYIGFNLNNRDLGLNMSIMNSGYYFDDDGETTFDSIYGGATFSYSKISESGVSSALNRSFGIVSARNEVSNLMSIEIEKVDLLNPIDYKEKEGTKHLLSYKETLTTAKKFLSDAGITDMKPSAMTLMYLMPQSIYDDAQEIYTANGGTGKFDYWNVENEIKAGKFDDQVEDVHVIVEFTRFYRGVPVSTAFSNSSGIYMGVGAESYNLQWAYESFYMSIEKSGIININWTSPYNIIETITEDSNMISFDEAVDIFENMYNIKFAGHLQTIVESAKAVHNINLALTHDGEVSKVTLSLRRVTEQNNIEKGLLVPVWDFWGVVTTTTWEDGVPYLEYQNYTDANIPLMSINAVDGTVIDLSKGY